MHRARRNPRHRWILVLVGLSWAATMVEVVRREVLGRSHSAEVRALVDQARLRKTHGRVRYSVTLLGRPVGHLSSSVSGDQRADQLAYVVTGQIDEPWPASIKGVVRADWERRVESFAAEVVLSNVPYRVDGSHGPDGRLSARLLDGEGQVLRADEWMPPLPMVLVRGALPVPSGYLDVLASGSEQAGKVAHPVTGAEVSWRLESSDLPEWDVAGEQRPAVRHVLETSVATLRLIVDTDGLPLQAELPLGLSIELSEQE